MSGWKGKEIDAFPETVAYQGSMVPAVRVRGVSTEPDATAAAAPADPDDAIGF